MYPGMIAAAAVVWRYGIRAIHSSRNTSAAVQYSDDTRRRKQDLDCWRWNITRVLTAIAQTTYTPDIRHFRRSLNFCTMTFVARVKFNVNRPRYRSITTMIPYRSAGPPHIHCDDHWFICWRVLWMRTHCTSLIITLCLCWLRLNKNKCFDSSVMQRRNISATTSVMLDDRTFWKFIIVKCDVAYSL